MDISDQFVPSSAVPVPSALDPKERRRRIWVVVVPVLGGLAFAASVLIAMVMIGFVRMGGSCGRVATAPEIAGARREILQIGVVWSLLPFGLAVVTKLLRSQWVPWAVLGALTLAYAGFMAAGTTDLQSLFCF